MRIKFIKVTYLFILAVIVARLFYWQVLRHDDMSVRADQQHLVSYDLEAPRGLILASDRSILASNKPAFILYGLPKVIKNKEEVAVALAKILAPTQKNLFCKDKEKEGTFSAQTDGNSQENSDYCPGLSLQGQKNIDSKIVGEVKKVLLEKLSQDLEWVILEKNIDLPIQSAIDKLNIGGIGFENQTSRFYPEASSTAHLLGFVGSDSLGRQTGYFGVEGYYNGELKGVGGVLTEEKDARGLPILLGTFFKKEAKSGRNLILNIDRTVQYVVEKNLKLGMEKYGAKSGSVVVMEPKTGAILAMDSFPNYDPNDFANFPKETFKNPVVADSYEPGSTFKVLVMAAAINENLIQPDTKCDICDGPVKIGTYDIRTWNNKYLPDLTMTDVIIHSDNTGMVFAGRKLGVDKMYTYIQNFGFGALTQVDLQDEASPDIRPKKDWKEIDLATASFGQGIAATPLQVVRAVAAIANGGYLMEPHVVKAIDENGKLTEIKPKVVGHPINEEAARKVTQMMVEAVNKGEAKFVALKGFNIAGKTGTAQIPVAGHYDPNKTIASFVGFAPAEDPKFVILVRYQEPSSSIFGAETAAPTFFNIAKELLMYYNIVPNN